MQDSDGKVMSKYHGHLRVSVKDAQLFVSSSHRGDPDINYVVFNAGTASLQHEGEGSGAGFTPQSTSTTLLKRSFKGFCSDLLLVIEYAP
ncbi:hypothetical protein MTO96_045699 [Rhipicephalus appendiculatus]